MTLTVLLEIRNGTAPRGRPTLSSIRRHSQRKFKAQRAVSSRAMPPNMRLVPPACSPVFKTRTYSISSSSTLRGRPQTLHVECVVGTTPSGGLSLDYTTRTDDIPQGQLNRHMFDLEVRGTSVFDFELDIHSPWTFQERSTTHVTYPSRSTPLVQYTRLDTEEASVSGVTRIMPPSAGAFGCRTFPPACPSPPSLTRYSSYQSYDQIGVGIPFLLHECHSWGSSVGCRCCAACQYPCSIQLGDVRPLDRYNPVPCRH